MRATLKERISALVDKHGPIYKGPVLGSAKDIGGTRCHLWTRKGDKDGYGTISVNGKLVRVHRVVWKLYKGRIPIGMLVLHRCDNTSCVNKKHLWLGTHHDNNKDMMLKGRYINGMKNNSEYARGEKNGNAKLKDQVVSNIKASWRTGKYTQSELAEKYKASRSTIHLIVNGKHWKHID